MRRITIRFRRGFQAVERGQGGDCRQTAPAGTEVELDPGLRGRANLPLQAARRLRSQGGSVLVEFAFAAPVLIMALTGTCSVAMAFYSLQQLTNACSSGVQAVASNQGFANDDDPCAFARTTVTGALPGWAAASFSYQLAITNTVTSSSGSTTTTTYFPTTQGSLATGTAFTCSSDSSFVEANATVALTVSYKYQWVPILSVKWSGLPPLSTTEGTSVQ